MDSCMLSAGDHAEVLTGQVHALPSGESLGLEIKLWKPPEQVAV